MLEFTDEHLVALAQKGRAPALRDEIDRFGRVAHKDDLTAIRSVQKPPNLVPRLLVKLGRTRAQSVNAAVHICVVGAIVIGSTVDDRPRLLSAGGGIEKH